MNMEMVVMMMGMIEIVGTFSLISLVQGALVEPLSSVENAHQLIKAIQIANTCAGVAGLVPFSSPCLRTRLTRLTVSCVLKYFCLGHCGFLKK